MITAKFEYKCRRCKEIEVNPCTSEENARLILICTIFGYKLPKEKQNLGPIPKTMNIHSCKDGGQGVSDLIGYQIVNE